MLYNIRVGVLQVLKLARLTRGMDDPIGVGTAREDLGQMTCMFYAVRMFFLLFLPSFGN